MRGVFAVTVCLAMLVGATAAQGSLPTLSSLTSSSSGQSGAATQAKSIKNSSTSTKSASSSSAGQPVDSKILLCGMWTQGMDRISGNSDIDHPNGASATGMEYPYTGQNCEDDQPTSTGPFSWTISHSNVNLVKEKGTEHGIANLAESDDHSVGFNGQITDYDFAPAPAPDPVACGDRLVYYASGHAYDPCGTIPSAPGNFNTHGGAQEGEHVVGKYGTLVYQYGDMTNSPCPKNSSDYCFEGILQGQQN